MNPMNARIGKSLPGDRQHGRVLVKRDQGAVRLDAFPEQRGMPADADGAIDDGLARPRIEPVEDFGGEDGDMRHSQFQAPG